MGFDNRDRNGLLCTRTVCAESFRKQECKRDRLVQKREANVNLCPALLLKLEKKKNPSSYVCLCTNDRPAKMQADTSALDSGRLQKKKNLHVFLFCSTKEIFLLLFISRTCHRTLTFCSYVLDYLAEKKYVSRRQNYPRLQSKSTSLLMFKDVEKP